LQSPGASAAANDSAQAVAGASADVPTDSPDTKQPGAAPARSDIEFAMDVTIPAGQELLRCIYAPFPADRGVIAVSGAESHYTPGSHHILAYRSDLTSTTIPEDQTGVFDCSDGEWQRHMRGSYYEAQQPDEERELPPGIAHKFQPNEVIILQAHYVNTTGEELNAHVKLKVHVTDLASVQQEAGSIMFNNGRLVVPPHSKSRTTMTCTLPQDINLALLWSHMHSRGTHFLATTDDPEAAAVLGDLFESDTWSEPRPRAYPADPPVTLHAGTHITFSCDYENTTDTEFHFGNSAPSNEMCLLHGMYWPRMSSFSEQCIGGPISNTAL
jgi:hypothetical protein